MLYELYTGKRAFEGISTTERASSTATPLSSHIQEIDPAVERVILGCLNALPEKRPASAIAVAAAFPGGDPLAAALAAGETPSPELVAQAGEVGGLEPLIAWTLLLLLVTGLGVVAWLGESTQLFNIVEWPKSPALLEERARDILQRFGYDQPAMDSQSGIAQDLRPLRWSRSQDGISVENLDYGILSYGSTEPASETSGTIRLLLFRE